jgi:hypothetical protein
MAQGQLAWMGYAQRDYTGAIGRLDVGLRWAGKIDTESTRALTECKLLTISAMVLMQLVRLREARATLLSVLSRGETLGATRLQLNAMINLTECASRLGKYVEMAEWAERTRALAFASGALVPLAVATQDVGRAAGFLGDTEAEIRWLEQSTALYRQAGNPRDEARPLWDLVDAHLRRGDAQTALRFCGELRALPEGVFRGLDSVKVATMEAHCEVLLGRPDVARAMVEPVLASLGSEFAGMPARKTIFERRACQQILAAAGDARAASMLDELYVDVQALAAELTDPDDRERLIEAHPAYRAIAHEYRERAQADARGASS